MEGGLLCHAQFTASSDPKDQSGTNNKESGVYSLVPSPCPEGSCKNLDRALLTRTGLVGFGSLRSEEILLTPLTPEGSSCSE